MLNMINIYKICSFKISFHMAFLSMEIFTLFHNLGMPTSWKNSKLIHLLKKALFLMFRPII